MIYNYSTSPPPRLLQPRINVSTTRRNRSASPEVIEALRSCATVFLSIRSCSIDAYSDLEIIFLSSRARNILIGFCLAINVSNAPCRKRTSRAPASSSFHASIMTPVGLAANARGSRSSTSDGAAPAFNPAPSSRSGIVSFATPASAIANPLRNSAPPPGKVILLSFPSSSTKCPRNVKRAIRATKGQASESAKSEMNSNHPISPRVIYCNGGIVA